MITALVGIFNDKLEIDHQTLIDRINKAKSELDKAMEEAPEKAIKKAKKTAQVKDNL